MVQELTLAVFVHLEKLFDQDSSKLELRYGKSFKLQTESDLK